MYGTVARMRVLPGKDEEMKRLGDEMSSMQVPGEVGGYVFKLDNAENEYILVALFEDRESYHRNAQSPESDQNYRKMRALLAADPEWNDGEVVQAFGHR